MNTITIDPLVFDDLVRTVAIIALSSNPLPPEWKNGKVIERTGFTASQHKLSVELCQKTMKKHNLYEYQCTTTSDL